MDENLITYTTWVCACCDKKYPSKDFTEYNSKAQYCCSGYECGCMGLPTEPPICNECWSEDTDGGFDK